MNYPIRVYKLTRHYHRSDTEARRDVGVNGRDLTAFTDLTVVLNGDPHVGDEVTIGEGAGLVAGHGPVTITARRWVRGWLELVGECVEDIRPARAT